MKYYAQNERGLAFTDDFVSFICFSAYRVHDFYVDESMVGYFPCNAEELYQDTGIKRSDFKLFTKEVSKDAL